MIDKVDSWPSPSAFFLRPQQVDHYSAPPCGCILDLGPDCLGKFCIKQRQTSVLGLVTCSSSLVMYFDCWARRGYICVIALEWCLQLLSCWNQIMLIISPGSDLFWFVTSEPPYRQIMFILGATSEQFVFLWNVKWQKCYIPFHGCVFSFTT